MYLLLLTVFVYSTYTHPSVEEYVQALEKIDFYAVKNDIEKMLTTPQDFWPPDFGNYGPFMIRQAWHCSGSYRIFDGRGGCDGARQRFDPERSWDDNTNLDKAKTLIWPIKEKYGLGLSWGDLIILTANTAIEMMGGPVLGFCAGRIDDVDGSESVILGPTWKQNSTYPCKLNGNCSSPFGSTTIGLIYLNPEGPLGNPIPEESAPEVRDTFGRMAMDDMETVALIGGGHAFGKAHGACPLGPGPSPKEDPANPWPGKCGTGKGKDTFTTGFEGAWSTQPTQWGNYYFQELVNNDWTIEIGPGGHHQWRPATNNTNVMMLTTDISLLRDPQGIYQSIVKLFASDLPRLNDTFSHAWYKLTTRDMGPVTRCVGPWVPPPQPFQYPLPSPPSILPDWGNVSADIIFLLHSDHSQILSPDPDPSGRPYYGALLTHLAWQCASTFRKTDYLGGCNGARIRFPPESNYPHNVAMDKLLSILELVKKKFSDNLSWSDLIVLSGIVALDEAAGVRYSQKLVKEVDFCGGRTDASDGQGATYLEPNGDFDIDVAQLRSKGRQIGFNDREIVVLSARLRSPSQLKRLGYESWTNDPTKLSNQYFQTLLNETWEPVTLPSGRKQYQAQGKDIFMVQTDLNLKWDAPFLAIAQEYASDNELFLKEFSAAWLKLMTIDRFAGPGRNLCDKNSQI